MKILAIETSCDETAIAIVDFSDSKQTPHILVLSNIVSSQVKLHAKFGGVVPNLAKREHQKNLSLILIKTLKEGRFSISKSKFLIFKQTQNSKFKILNSILGREPELLRQFIKKILPLKPPDINAIAVTYGPGLAPALWVGVNFARALSFLWKKPLIPVNHMAGHFFSAFPKKSRKENNQLSIIKYQFPILGLLVSGGHTELVLVQKPWKFQIIGETLDDAAGEAFDKVARIVGLDYPGGPAISRLAQDGDPKRYPLPRPMLNSKDYNFSFSGLKTAVLYFVRDHKTFSRKDLAASFEHAVVDVLMAKTIRAAKMYKVKTVLLGGGVAANTLLRKTLGEKIKKELPNGTYLLPSPEITGDNALMIALAAHFSGTKRPWHTLKAEPNLRLSKS